MPDQICAGVMLYDCPGGRVEDVGFYKEGAVAVLTRGAGGQQKGRLALLPTAALAWQPLPAAALNAEPIGSQVSCFLISAQHVSDLKHSTVSLLLVQDVHQQGRQSTLIEMDASEHHGICPPSTES